MKDSKPDNVIQFKDVQRVKNRKTRQIPSEIFGVSEAALFDKRADRRTIGFCADEINASRREKEDPPLIAYEMCEQRGGLAALQKILEQGDAHESTRFKLLIAYKAALADSDAFIGSLADTVDFSKPLGNDLDRSYIGRLFWIMDPYSLGRVIRERGWKPPTLAAVRRYFISMYPKCQDNWPGGNESRNKVHRTTIVRMGLPLAKDRIGRPPKVKTRR